jgi:hypothetical protein
VSRALVLALAALAGCATIDVYHYEPRALPTGSQPLAVVSWSLQDLRNVSWSYGEPDPDPSRRALVKPTNSGVIAEPNVTLAAGMPLDISYGEIADGVRMVTQMSGSWTVYIYDHRDRLVQLEFASYAAARLFLDAAHALAVAPPSGEVDIASIKN